MINYLSKFLPILSEIAEPIRELPKDKHPFNWGPDHQQAFTQMKREISSALVLAYYKPKKPTMLQTDASIKGLGACSLQGGNHVYLQTKPYLKLKRVCCYWNWITCSGLGNREVSALLYASHFILKTDRKPLKAILSKSLNQPTPRLQWILIRTFADHFTVRCIPGITNQLADCLSCLGGQKDSIKLPKHQVHQITIHLNTRSDCLQEIRIAMQVDDQPVVLKHTITHGWPNTIREVPSEIQSFWTFREELTVDGGIVLKGTCIVIPSKKCQAIIHLIHEGHLGLTKCKLRAKDTVYLPGLNEDLGKLILNCELCLKYSHSKCKQKPSTSSGQ